MVRAAQFARVDVGCRLVVADVDPESLEPLSVRLGGEASPPVNLDVEPVEPTFDLGDLSARVVEQVPELVSHRRGSSRIGVPLGSM